jgi:hypothetical protein
LAPTTDGKLWSSQCPCDGNDPCFDAFFEEVFAFQPDSVYRRNANVEVSVTKTQFRRSNNKKTENTKRLCFLTFQIAKRGTSETKSNSAWEKTFRQPQASDS